MFPIKDDIPTRQFPAVNIALIVINAAVFLFEMSLGNGIDQFIDQFGFIPARFMAHRAENMLDFSRFLPVFSSMFLHGSLLHLLSNMWMLWIFGDNVEDCMGHGRYLIFFLLCGTVSVFSQATAAPYSEMPMLGASGAISGVLGAYLLTYPRARVLTLVPIFILFYIVELPAFFVLGLWILMQFLSGYASLTSMGAEDGGIAWWAHIGGFGAGAVLIYLFRREEWRSPYTRSAGRIRRLGR